MLNHFNTSRQHLQKEFTSLLSCLTPLKALVILPRLTIQFFLTHIDYNNVSKVSQESEF